MDMPIRLKEAESIEIITLVDNYADALIPGNDIVQRPSVSKGEEISRDTFIAEHGLSLLVTVKHASESHTILLDTGYSSLTLLHNMDNLGIDPDSIETIVLSHFHMDHTGSLYPLLDRMSSRVTVAFHPFAFHHPRFITHDGEDEMTRFPRTLVREELENADVDLLLNQGPAVIADDFITLTGEIERTTGFEKGLPNAQTEMEGKNVQDPMKDDQSIIINLKGKGLVIISGCSHAGIINTLQFSKKITGIDKIYGVFGGFHLGGPIFEPIIKDTVSEMENINPKVLVPMHCTGREAVNRLESTFPDAFILNTVGSKFTL